MFTGIIEELGAVEGLERKGPSAVLSVRAKKISTDTIKGDSISVNGTCLTIVGNSAGILKFDVSEETLKKSNIGALKPNDRVNLEHALKANSRLGGHFVAGHVDCIVEIRQRQKFQDYEKIEFKMQPEISRFIVPKGSVAVDGISLTVAEVSKDSFTAYIIPHTLANTTLGFKKGTDTVNIEADILAKYVEKSKSPPKEGKITAEFLSRHGFI